MASWQRYFKPVDSKILNPQDIQTYHKSHTGLSGANYQSYLPQVYQGAPNRIERYVQYENMDLDSHVSASLDIIAEFCTQNNETTGVPFEFFFKSDNITPNETEILNRSLMRWVKLNEFDNRLFDIVRGVLKFGDQFFVRDPETYKWLFVYHANVEKICADESRGKKLEFYSIKDLDLNMQGMVISNVPSTQAGNVPNMPGQAFNNIAHNTKVSTYGRATTRFTETMGSTNVDAKHMVHLSMNNGLDPNWPFGTSILEKVFKTYKQKELLEDSIIIYRVQRAPERRVFYIDVGDLPEAKAMAFVEQMKNSIHQRRIPSQTGGGSNIMDASYNPMSILDDLFFAQNVEGKGSRVETLAGGDPTWGINELLYFDNKLARGLRVPSSYLPTGPEDSTATYNDGKVGTALIQEMRFSKFCERIQMGLSRIFDDEFKLYLKKNDININSSYFEIRFTKPQSFASWRKVEMDGAKINNFNQIQSVPFISRRYAMKEYLGMTEDQIMTNTRMLAEENPSKFKNLVDAQNYIDSSSSAKEMRSVGIDSMDVFDDEIQQDLENPLDNLDSVDTDSEIAPGLGNTIPPEEPNQQ